MVLRGAEINRCTILDASNGDALPIAENEEEVFEGISFEGISFGNRGFCGLHYLRNGLFFNDLKRTKTLVRTEHLMIFGTLEYNCFRFTRLMCFF